MKTVVQPEDYKYYKNDPNFNPVRNQAIIQETIEGTEKFFRELGRKVDDEGMNRIDMVSSYGVKRLGTGTTKTFRAFLGEKRYKDLIGEEILEKVRVMRTVNQLNGNDKYMDFILK